MADVAPPVDAASTTPVAPEESAPEIVSAFPAPPAFFVLYRDGVSSGPPPPEPMAPQYHMFGTPYSTQDAVPDLLPQPGKKLYLPDTLGHGATVGGDAATAGVSSGADAAGGAQAGAAAEHPARAAGDGAGSIDYKTQLKKMNRSLLANFVELVDVLIHKPAMFNEKLDDIELLFLNMHNLINAFRPQQARETIIHQLRTQIQERRDAVQDIRRSIDEARKAVEETHSQLHDTAFDAPRSQDVDIKMEETEGAKRLGTESAGFVESVQSPRVTPPEVSVKAREIQTMQDSFFAALQAVVESTTN
ncbi:hypothetical protein P43SY_002524 [Pythium insidiosum]|uniref:Mediator of RNA polymerase II transcription subunit 7 n=1 Tax=Pythium insidiosum TaxID=114742 RepID=A0AAD5LUP9_PYTIN|nr:hypothetical protein P43SY_002524 [Pythium insidiosum]